MGLAPEIKTIPEMIGKFTRAGLASELINAMIKGERARDIAKDARKFIDSLENKSSIKINGLENIPDKTGGLIAFNHPNMDVLLPGILKLISDLDEQNDKKIKMLMGAEIPLVAKFNKAYPIPGSIPFIKRFHQLYSENIIPVPISDARKDYATGRAKALRDAMKAIKEGFIILVAPEGHVEIENNVSPKETFHKGTGAMAMLAGKMNFPTIPVGIWQDKDINIQIGRPFVVKLDNPIESVELIMKKVSEEMPENLRGPYF